MDYTGPFLNKMFLVIIDAHSKWLEVLPVNNATTAATMEQLLNVFTTHGLPNTIVLYNGSVLQVTNSPTSSIKMVLNTSESHRTIALPTAWLRCQFKHLRITEGPD